MARPGEGAAPQLDDRGPEQPTSSASALPPQAFRHLVRRLHALGPRPTGELLLEIGRAHRIEDDVARRLERIAMLDPATVAALDGQDWPSMPPAVVEL